MSKFKNLYSKICNTISNALEEKCLINNDADLAFPGFNIFTPYKNCEKIDGPPHIDLQWSYHIENLKRIFKDVSTERFLTFTLSVHLPESGGGLYIWPLDHHEICEYEKAKYAYKDIILKCKSLLVNKDSIDKDFFEREAKPELIQYEEGYMTLFDNLLLHQVAPFNLPYRQDEERITLQGHGIKCDNIWRLFF